MRALRRTALVALSTTLALTACGGGQKQNGEDKKSATQIVSDVRGAIASASSVHVTGHITVPGTGSVVLDLHLKGQHSGQGTVTVQGAKLNVVRLENDLYLRATAASYAKLKVPSTEADLIAGKWIKAPATASDFKDLSDLIGLSSVSQLLQPTGTLQKGAKTSVNGTDTIAIRDVTAGKTTGTVYVSLTGKPYPLRAVGADSRQATGSVDFTDWDKSVSISPPSGAFDVSPFLK